MPRFNLRWSSPLCYGLAVQKREGELFCRAEWEKHQERRRGIETHYNSTLEHLESIKCVPLSLNPQAIL